MLGKVLIVDDSLVARLSLKGILKDKAAAILEANSGEAALAVLASGESPDMVFLDLTMPGKGGVETLREFVASYPSLPVVVVTADIQASTIGQVEAIGAAAVVRKPADRGEVLAALERLAHAPRP